MRREWEREREMRDKEREKERLIFHVYGGI